MLEEDWLYRQYLVGVGDSAPEADGGIRQVLGAAAGWADRPSTEDELAELIVRFSLRKSSGAAAGGQVLGGWPFSWEKLGASYRSLWSNRLVMLLPLLLRAHRETGEEKYARAARLLFEDVLMSQVEKNPQGYFWAWGQSARKAELFDPNYNMAAYDRGIIDFWSEGELALIGREKAAAFTSAQARYLVFSGQFLDTFETDSMTAVQSHFPGGIPSGRPLPLRRFPLLPRPGGGSDPLGCDQRRRDRGAPGRPPELLLLEDREPRRGLLGVRHRERRTVPLQHRPGHARALAGRLGIESWRLKSMRSTMLFGFERGFDRKAGGP